ncbi:MAG: ribosomal RNA small subunit methyltransferase A, partial [Marinilabiliales bacterium]
IAKKIVDSLSPETDNLIEIGAGTGILTQFLIKKETNLLILDVDTESIDILHEKFPEQKNKIILQDFLKLNLPDAFENNFSIIGNLPYNISSQIFFHVLNSVVWVDEMVVMIQKEVAERIVSPPGSKTYGILSVLLQTYFTCEYLFSVSPGVFIPPPKVKSAVIRLKNKKNKPDFNEKLFRTVVKQAFNQRRKTLSNSLKSLANEHTRKHEIFTKRPEQLKFEQFAFITQQIENQASDY